MLKISETDLIINADGSIYHLNLLPGDVADTVITVGDPDRVGEVSKHFDSIEFKKGKREFITHTGSLGGERLTVISTGMGTDNIDIVLNELDALVNIDFETRLIKTQLKSLNIIRIGTSGAVQPGIPIDSLLVSKGALGLDVLMQYYQHDLDMDDEQILNRFKVELPVGYGLQPYYALPNAKLLEILASDLTKGITLTAPGFYAAQGRQVRAVSATPELMKNIQNYNYNGNRIANLEMETAGIYGLSTSLGHKAISFNVILANRATKVFSKQPAEIMEHFIGIILQRITNVL
jgi:uridine phosphorylase